MNIQQILTQQKSLISHIDDENTAFLTSHDYRRWLAESLGKTQSFLIAHDDYELSESELLQYQQGMEKLQNGVPLAYVTGHQPFYLLDFLVNEHTLIPRSDTQVLLDTALNFYDYMFRDFPLSQKVTVLDLGTGSGCVAISIAHYLKSQKRKYQVVATDFSAEALKVAEQNALLNKVKVDFLQGDWFTALNDTPFAKLKFDIIVSNPPYIDPTDPHLKALKDEPITALVADNHGLADIFTIIQNAKNWLEVGGLLAIEHGYQQGEAVRAYFTQQDYGQVTTSKDMGGNDRVTYGIWVK